MKDKEMYGHGGRAKAGHGGNMYGRKKKMGGGQMYAKGGKAHSGAQPVYGNTVETSMPKAGAN